jgi:hypothetical protein
MIFRQTTVIFCSEDEEDNIDGGWGWVVVAGKPQQIHVEEKKNGVAGSEG